MDNRQRQSPIVDGMLDIIAQLRALNLAYHHKHINVQGSDYYGDHQLLQRLYFGQGADNAGQPILEIDSVMERLRGLDFNAPLHANEISRRTTDILEQVFPDQNVTWEGLYGLEMLLQRDLAVLQDWFAQQEERGDYRSPGVLNLLQDIADRHQGNLYLLNQRMGGQGAPLPQQPAVPGFPQHSISPPLDVDAGMPALVGQPGIGPMRNWPRGIRRRGRGRPPRRRRRMFGPGSGPNPDCPWRDAPPPRPVGG